MSVRVFVPRDATACALGADAVAAAIGKGAISRGLDLQLVRNGSTPSTGGTSRGEGR